MADQENQRGNDNNPLNDPRESLTLADLALRAGRNHRRCSDRLREIPWHLLLIIPWTTLSIVYFAVSLSVWLSDAKVSTPCRLSLSRTWIPAVIGVIVGDISVIAMVIGLKHLTDDPRMLMIQGVTYVILISIQSNPASTQKNTTHGKSLSEWAAYAKVMNGLTLALLSLLGCAFAYLVLRQVLSRCAPQKPRPLGPPIELSELTVGEVGKPD